jgi:hypothetical protein
MFLNPHNRCKCNIGRITNFVRLISTRDSHCSIHIIGKNGANYEIKSKEHVTFFALYLGTLRHTVYKSWSFVLECKNFFKFFVDCYNFRSYVTSLEDLLSTKDNCAFFKTF